MKQQDEKIPTCVVKLELTFEKREDKAILDGQSKICNWTYNFLLQFVFLFFDQMTALGPDPEILKMFYSKRGLRNLLPDLKKAFPFLKVVYASCLKNAALRLSSAIIDSQECKKGKRKGKVKFPHFRSQKAKWFSLLYDYKGYSLDGDLLIISLGMGEDRKHRSLTLRIKEAHLMQSKTIRNVRIVCQREKYYAIFTVQPELPAAKPIRTAIAFDPNHKNFVYGRDTLGNGIEILSPALLFKNHDKHIDELRSLRDGCKRKAHKIEIIDKDGKPTGKHYYKPSRRWLKYNKALQDALHTRREQIKTYMFTLAHYIVRYYDFITIGDYAPRGGGITTAMRRSMNNQSAIGRFLGWVAEKSGKTFTIFEETGTTRTCSHCHYVVEGGIHVTIREWTCP